MSREIDSAACAAITGLTRETWTAYVRARRPKHSPPPLPVRTIGRTPVWHEDSVRAWSANRPGRGARLDLRAEGRDADVPAATA